MQDTVVYDEKKNAIVIIDQTKLPNERVFLYLKTQKEIWNAIYLLQVRGAPAIGVTAGYALYMAALEIEKKAVTQDDFFEELHQSALYLNTSRPTAVNLSWALKRMEKIAFLYRGENEHKIVCEMKKEADDIWHDDIITCKKIGEYGLTLLQDGDGLLTHCNAGRLATVRYGTATAPMYLGKEKGFHFQIYVDETRPLLQGARLTAYELMEAGMDVTLLCDNMSVSLMKTGCIQAVFVGCDRVAANGDVANKIGTFMVAMAAHQYQIPFYVCAPTSTIDFQCASGANIPIEQRSDEEVVAMWYKERKAPVGVKVYNPAFDVTDHDFIDAIITEKGIFRAPYVETLKTIQNCQ